MLPRSLLKTVPPMDIDPDELIETARQANEQAEAATQTTQTGQTGSGSDRGG